MRSASNGLSRLGNDFLLPPDGAGAEALTLALLPGVGASGPSEAESEVRRASTSRSACDAVWCDILEGSTVGITVSGGASEGARGGSCLTRLSSCFVCVKKRMSDQTMEKSGAELSDVGDRWWLLAARPNR